jgi:putative ABC transport system substrate-binding protein
MPVIGVLNPTSPEANVGRLGASRQGLKEAGYVEGENVAIDYRWAQGQNDRLPALAAELARRLLGIRCCAMRNRGFVRQQQQI